MKPFLKSLDGLAAETLDTIAGLRPGKSGTVDLGVGHMPVHVARVPSPIGSALSIAHFFEAGSRRGGLVFVPAPEMVFARTPGGWTPVSLRDAFAARIAIEVTGESVVVDESAHVELVELANVWLANIRSRLAGDARRAA
jgi:hypothetical protein